MKPIITAPLKHGTAVWINPIIQIGYDYILATGEKRQELSRDLDDWLGRIGHLDQREAVLQKIRNDFGIQDAETDTPAA